MGAKRGRYLNYFRLVLVLLYICAYVCVCGLVLQPSWSGNIHKSLLIYPFRLFYILSAATGKARSESHCITYIAFN
jgi:hypothetical protein